VGQICGVVQVGDRAARVGVSAHPREPVEEDRAFARLAALGFQEGQRRLESFRRDQQRIGPLGALARADQPRRRTRVPGTLQMRGDIVGIGPRLGQQRLGHPAVPGAAARRE